MRTGHQPYSLLAAVFLGALPLVGQPATESATLFRNYCAPCHGQQMEGGNAQSLIDAVWQFGSKKSHLFRNIKYGIADFAMPAFDAALSDDQINDLIDYIFSREKASGATKPHPPERIFTLDYEVRIEVLAQDLDIPWGICFTRPEQAFVTERSGSIRQLLAGRLLPDPVEGTPPVLHEGQGGLLDIAVDPEFEENQWIYLAYSHPLPSLSNDRRASAMTRIVRGRIRNNRWVDQQIVFEAPSETYQPTRHHYGSRIVFDTQHRLYFSVGDRGLSHQAQDLSQPNGKIHRLHRDGTIPVENPFLTRFNALPSIYSYGHRNPQGLAVHPSTGMIWESEHGPMGGDELNQLARGANFGWPEITYGRNYDGATVSDLTHQPGMEQPRLYWKPSIAVCGIAFVSESSFTRWNDHLLVGALKYEELRLLAIAEGRVVHQEILLKNSGRIRDVANGPDGAIYVITNGPGMILKLTPIRDLNGNPNE